MSRPFDVSLLQPGDAILYFRHNFFSWLVALKTWTKVAHVEIYQGNNTCLSSRIESGVNAYPLRTDHVAAVLRPRQPLNLVMADRWFSFVRGYDYDWLGLLCFTLVVRHGERRKMFCSEFATHYYQHAGFEPFNPHWPADHVSPSFFLASPAFDIVWTDRDWF